MVRLPWASQQRRPRITTRRAAFVSLLIAPALILAAGGTTAALGRADLGPAPAGACESVDSVAAADSATVTLSGLQTQLENLYQQVNPSVVNIKVAAQAPRAPGGGPGTGAPSTNDPAPSQPTQYAPQTLGSGFVWDAQGFIITNNHVVDSGDKITVTFSDGLVAEATLVGTDHDADLAVLKVQVPPSRLKPIAVADSSKVRVGQIVIALGNPYGLHGSMTMGIVSAIGRSLGAGSAAPSSTRYTIPDIIQTDASINPGNSGGVLVDAQGKLIGVPSAIIFSGGTSSGIGFAIPTGIVSKVVPAIIKSGSYQHPWLGASFTALSPGVAQRMGLNPDQRGALVTDVMPASPAATSGLQGGSQQVAADGMNVKVGGDVITAINGAPVHDVNDLVGYLATHTDVGQTVTLTIVRGGKEMTVPVTLAPRPAK